MTQKQSKAVGAPDGGHEINLRIPGSIVARAGDLSNRLTERAGVRVRRNAVILAALDKGLALLAADNVERIEGPTS